MQVSDDFVIFAAKFVGLRKAERVRGAAGIKHPEFTNNIVSILEKLQTAIETELTEKQRFAIRASLEGIPVEVIAEKSGSNRNSIYKLVHDARIKLRRRLEKAGVVADDLVSAFASVEGS